MPRRRRTRTREQLVTEFWFNVHICASDVCWWWTGYVEEGYGRFFDGERMRFAHDLALEWYSGEPRPEGFDTCHSCNTPLCCNPWHLRYDSRQSNVDDMMAAGTHVPGTIKLSDDQVRMIRERAAAGAAGRDLAEQYGVSASLITMIVRGTKRASAGGPIRTNHANSRESTWQTTQ